MEGLHVDQRNHRGRGQRARPAAGRTQDDLSASQGPSGDQRKRHIVTHRP